MNWKAACEDGSIHAYAAAVDEVIRRLLGKTYNSLSEIDGEVSLVSTHISVAASSLLPEMTKTEKALLKQSRVEF